MLILAGLLRRPRRRDRLRVGADVDALPRAHERRDIDVELLLPRQPLLVGRDGEARGEGGEVELLLIGAVEVDRPQRALVLALDRHEVEAVVRRAELREGTLL